MTNKKATAVARGRGRPRGSYSATALRTTIVIRLATADYEALTLAAQSRGESVSQYVRAAINRPAGQREGKNEHI